MVAVEGTATLPGEGGWQTEAEQPKRALPGAGPERKPAEPEEFARVPTEHFFDQCCDRPGYYEVFRRARRSPLQHFCSTGSRITSLILLSQAGLGGMGVTDYVSARVRKKQRNE